MDQLPSVQEKKGSATSAGKAEVDFAVCSQGEIPANKLIPEAEDLRTLRRVPGEINFNAFTVAFIELCERFTYYGTGQLRKGPSYY